MAEIEVTQADQRATHVLFATLADGRLDNSQLKEAADIAFAHHRQQETAKLREALDLLAICREWLEPDAFYTMASRQKIFARIDQAIRSADHG